MSNPYDHPDRGPAAPLSEPEAGAPEPRSASAVDRDGSAESAESAAGRSQQPPRPFWQELLLLLGIALVLAVVTKALFLQAFWIPSGSMNDTLVYNDRILVQKVSYWGSGTPQRGDVVVFEDPGGWLDPRDEKPATTLPAKVLEVLGLYPTGGHLVKRVIGVGGDDVVCCDAEGRVTVNGVALNEKSYLAKGEKPSLETFSIDVPPGYLWVQGDNRSHSQDSRAHRNGPGHGLVPVDNVVGKAFVVVWPLGHAKLISRPATLDSVDQD